MEKQKCKYCDAEIDETGWNHKIQCELKHYQNKVNGVNKENERIRRNLNSYVSKWTHQLRTIQNLVKHVEFQSMDSAPKDGTTIMLLTIQDSIDGCIRPPTVECGKWNPRGDSWVERDGKTNLEVTGVWSCGSGWLQPDEVSGWLPFENFDKKD